MLWWKFWPKNFKLFLKVLPYFPYNPKAKLRLEVLFKKFHPRMNLTTLFLTESYLLNTIKPFSGHENRSLTKFQKTSTRGVPLGTWTSKFWVCRTSSWPKWDREPKFQLSRSYGLGCRRGKNFCQRRRRRRVTDGKKFIAFFHVLWLFIGKNMIWAKTIFQKFWCETNNFNIMMKVKMERKGSKLKFLGIFFINVKFLIESS
jgi:hypothetical protein